MPETLTEKLRARPPLLHGGGSDYFGLAWPALGWLERTLGSDMRTLETGCGASTAVFAARGGDHVVITPSRDEWERLSRYCASEGIGLERVRHICEPSHVALAGSWSPTPLDVVLVDGAHGFPFPILDWFYTAPHVRVGGRVLVDDAYLPSVNVLVQFLRQSPSWELERVLGQRTACFRKLDEEALSFDWLGSRFDRRPKFNYLAPSRRPLALGRYWVDRSSFGRFVVRTLRNRVRLR